MNRAKPTPSLNTDQDSSSRQLSIIIDSTSPTSPGPSSSATTVVPRRRSPPSYGATSSNERPPRRDTLNRVPEDDTVDFDEQSTSDESSELEEELALEERGLYKGSYERLVLVYSLTPLTLLLGVVLFALLPLVWFHPNQTTPYPYAPFVPYPVPELVVSAGLWALLHLLKDPIYSSCALLLPTALSILASTIIQTVLAVAFRLLAFPILLIPHYMVYPMPTWHDLAFGRVWWIALGWAIAESLVAIKQGYDAIGLYRDVLVKVKKRIDVPFVSSNAKQPSQHSSLTGASNHSLPDLARDTDDRGERDSLLPPDMERADLCLHDSVQLQLDQDFERLIALKEREELEEIYGLPIIRIPVFISCLQRINSLLLAIGFTLLLSAAYIRSPFSSQTRNRPVVFPPIPPHDMAGDDNKSSKPLEVVLPVVFFLQLFLNILHTQLVLPMIGVHTVVYIGLLMALGTFFAGLGMWQALT